MDEVRRAARLIVRLWPAMDPDDAESCAGEAAAQVGTDNRTLLQAAAKRRAIDLYRSFYATSRRGAPLTRKHLVLTDGIAATLADKGRPVEDRATDIELAREVAAGLSGRERLIVAALAEGWPLRRIAARLGVTESRVGQLRHAMAGRVGWRAA